MTYVEIQNVRAEELDHITHSHVLEIGTDKVQLRMALGLLTAIIIYNLWEPATYIWFIDDSLAYKTAALLHANSIIGSIFILCGLMMAPHLVSLVLIPSLLSCKAPRRMAAAGGVMGAVLWFLMAFVSKDLDSNWVMPVFAIRAVVYMGVAFVYATSLNSQRAREFINDS